MIKKYIIDSYWGARAESLESLASRYLRMVDALSEIDPVFNPPYFIGKRRLIPLDEIRTKLPKRIAKCVSRDDQGHPEPVYGYNISWSNDKWRSPQNLTIMGRVGNTIGPGYTNHVGLDTSNEFLSLTDPEIVTYRIFRAAMLAIIRAWDVTWCGAFPKELMDYWPNSEGHPFPPAWMTYVSPRFAPLITPPALVEAERFEDGGLLMVATRERFLVSDVDHMLAASAIDEALAPLNALPWPPDAPE